MNLLLFCGLPNQHTTQEFGHLGHKGRDSRALSPETVYASGTGVVIRVRTNDLIYGYCVTTRYDTPTGHVDVLDGHLSKISVVQGQTVELTTAIGKTGGTPGTPGAGVSQSPHLHEGCWVNGTLTDPNLVLVSRTQSTSGTATPITEESESDMKVIKNSTTGELWISAPGVFVLFPTGSYANAEAVLAQAYGLTTLFPNDVLTARAAALLAAPPTGGGSGGLTAAQDAKLTAIPSADADVVDEAELGIAETNAVNLTLAGVQTKLDAAVTAINTHTDSKFDGLTLSTP